MNIRVLNVLVAVGMAALIATAVYKAGPGAVAPQLAEVLKPESRTPEDALARGVKFLQSRQSPDGAWRSDVYATFRDGTALTPMVLLALRNADALPGEVRKAETWLASKVRADGTIDEGPDGLPYPVYTAALSIRAFGWSREVNAAARNGWRKYLLDRQLTEHNGWSPTDEHHGGWGYYPNVPRKPGRGEVVPAQHLLESNLSATAIAVDGLAAGDADESVWRAAYLFVIRCRNKDGGFHLVSGDPVRNKAGADGLGFHSYGSASADGLRARYECICRMNVEVSATEYPDWLDKYFEADRHPGNYIPAHEPNRNAVYFYYAASVAKTQFQRGRKFVGDKPWAAPLAAALAAKQNPDGSWANPIELVRENDQVLATAYAVQALALCRLSQ